MEFIQSELERHFLHWIEEYLGKEIWDKLFSELKSKEEKDLHVTMEDGSKAYITFYYECANLYIQYEDCQLTLDTLGEVDFSTKEIYLRTYQNGSLLIEQRNHWDYEILGYEELLTLLNSTRFISYYMYERVENDFVKNFFNTETLATFSNLYEFILLTRLKTEESPTLLPYDTDVVDYYRKSQKDYLNGLYYGMELEYLLGKNKNSLVKSLWKMILEDKAVLTEDSTVHGEVKLLPMRKEELLEYVYKHKKFFESIETGLYWGEDNWLCSAVGFHTHINKSALKSKLALSRLVVLLHEIALKDNLCNFFYGGVCDEYAKRCKKDLTSDTCYHEGVEVKDHTVEIRFFRATNSYKEVQKRLEFIERAVNFANGTKEVTIDKFLYNKQWVRDYIRDTGPEDCWNKFKLQSRETKADF